MAGAKGESGADAGVSGTSAADTTLGPCRPMRGDGGGGRIAESLQLTGGSGQQLDTITLRQRHLFQRRG